MIQNRLSAHIGYLFNEFPLVARIAAAAKAGFTAIEHPQPFSIPKADMRAALLENGLSFSQVAAGTGDPAKGEKGLAALPGRSLDFQRSFDVALEYAIAIGAPYIQPMAGIATNSSAEEAFEVYLDNIQYAVEQTSGTNVKVLIEAISQQAIPAYAISTLEQACKVQNIFGPGNLSLLVDTFHAAADGIVIEHWIPQHIHRIGHIHMADYPGRHEPGTGFIDFDTILKILAEHQYREAIGFEYIPSISTAQSLAFLPGWKSRQHSRPAEWTEIRRT